MQTADVVIVRDELHTLPALLDLARRARRLVVQNLAFAGCAIAALVALDFTGHLPLVLGVAGHEGSTILVGLNGLRLLRHPWPTPHTRGDGNEPSNRPGKARSGRRKRRRHESAGDVTNQPGGPRCLTR